MAVNLEQKYQEFQEATGDSLTRLRFIGYEIPYLNSKISNFEEFRKVITDDSYIKRDVMVKSLKQCYKNYIGRGDLIQILKNGETGFSDYEVAEAIKMIPVDADGGVNVDDLAEFLYK